MPDRPPTCIPYSPPGAHVYPKAFYTVQEVAQLLSFTPETIRDMILDRQLAALVIRKHRRHRLRIPAAELVRLLTPLSGRGK